MSTPLFYPQPKYVAAIRREGALLTIDDLCRENGIPCRLTGRGSQREVMIVDAPEPFIEVEPFGGAVKIGVPKKFSGKLSRKYALAAMAYSVFDLAARESVRGNRDFCDIMIIGRPRQGRAKTNAERQRKFRGKAANL